MWDLIVSVPDHCLSFYFSYAREKIRWVFKLLYESSETIHTKYLGLLASEMLFKRPLNTQSTQRHVTHATKTVKKQIAF